MRTLFTFILTLALTGCATSMPKSAVSEYVETLSGGFVMNRRNQGVQYGMTYTLRKPLGANPSYKAEFESTIPNGVPVFTEGSINETEEDLIVLSPVIAGVKNDTTYNVTLSLYSQDQLIAIHKDQVYFSIQSDILNTFGVREY